MSTESEAIQYSDMMAPGAWEKMIANTRAYAESLTLVENGLTQIAKMNGRVISASGNAVSLDDYKKESDAVNKINVAYEAKIKLMREQADIDKQMVVYKDNLRKANKAEADQAKSNNVANAEAVKIAKLTEKVNESAKGSYNQLSAQLSLATLKWHKLSQEERVSSETGRTLTKEKEELTKRLTALDFQTGKYSRNVGNYQVNLRKLGMGVKGLTGLLNELGLAFGIDTSALDTFRSAGDGLASTIKELHHVEGLENVAKKESIDLTNEQTASSAEQVGAIEAQTAAIEEQTIAQELLNAVEMMTPVGIILAVAAAVATATVAIAGYAYQSDITKRAEEQRSKAVDGTIIKDKELRDEYNKHVQTLKEVSNAYAVLNGDMTDFEAECDNAKEKYAIAVNDINNETNAQIIEVGGIWNQLWNNIKGGGTPSGLVQQNMNQVVDIMNKGADQVAAKQLELDDTVIKAKEKADEESQKATLALWKDTRKLEDESIKNKRIRAAKELEDEKNDKITELNDSKATAEAIAEETMAINKRYHFQLSELKDQWAKEDFKRENDEIDRELKLRNDKLNALKDLQDRFNSLRDENNPDQSATEKENERYQKQLDELDSISEEAKKKKVFDQKEYDDEIQRIESVHYQNLTNIEVDAETKKQEELDKIQKKADEDKKKADEKRKEELKKQLEEQIQFQKQMLDSISKAESNKYTQDENALKNKTAMIDSETQTQATLFSQGLDNTLSYEKAQRAKAYADQAALDKKKQEQEQALQLASLFMEFEKVYAKDGLAGGAKAFAQTMAAKGIANAIAGSAFDGVENTGDKNGNGVDGKGGSYWILHPNERVIPKALNDKIGDVSNEELVSKAWMFDNVYTPNYIGKTQADILPKKNSEMIALSLLRNELHDLKNVVKNKREYGIEFDDHKNIVENIYENGIRKKRVHQKDV